MSMQADVEHEEYQHFSDVSKWRYDLATHSLKRVPIQGIVVEIVDVENGFYQPIVERVGVARLNPEPRRFQNIDSAKEYAWAIFKEALATFPQDDVPPVNVDM